MIVMTYRKLTALTLTFCFLFHLGYGQQTSKKDVYILFKADQANTFKITTIDTAFYNRTAKLRGLASNRDLYLFMVKNKYGVLEKFGYETINNSRYYISDTTFVNFAAKSFEELWKIEDFHYDTRDKGYPFRRVFIVEYLAENKFKIVEVEGYLGVE